MFVEFSRNEIDIFFKLLKKKILNNKRVFVGEIKV